MIIKKKIGIVEDEKEEEEDDNVADYSFISQRLNNEYLITSKYFF